MARSSQVQPPRVDPLCGVTRFSQGSYVCETPVRSPFVDNHVDGGFRWADKSVRIDPTGPLGEDSPGESGDGTSRKDNRTAAHCVSREPWERLPCRTIYLWRRSS